MWMKMHVQDYRIQNWLQQLHPQSSKRFSSSSLDWLCSLPTSMLIAIKIGFGGMKLRTFCCITFGDVFNFNKGRLMQLLSNIIISDDGRYKPTVFDVVLCVFPEILFWVFWYLTMARPQFSGAARTIWREPAISKWQNYYDNNIVLGTLMQTQKHNYCIRPKLSQVK